MHFWWCSILVLVAAGWCVWRVFMIMREHVTQ